MITIIGYTILFIVWFAAMSVLYDMVKHNQEQKAKKRHWQQQRNGITYKRSK